VKLVLADEAIDAVLVIFSAPLSPHLEGIVGAILGAAAASTGKPLLASVLGRQVVMGGSEGRVPSFAFPESAVRALGRVGLYAEWRRRPAGQVIQFGDVDREAARRLVDRWLRDTAEPVWLDPTSAGQLLGAYGISAGSSGPPAGVATVVEVIEDRLFGPLIAFGAGGLAAELPGDRAFRSLPLTDLDAADLVRTGPVARLLAGVAGAPPANLPALEELLLRMAQLADGVPEIVELVLDPVVAGPETATAGSARVRLAPRPPRPEQGLRRLR
jgi:acyl-CoA synthetase (NDP forming)